MSTIKQGQPGSAAALTANELRELLAKVAASEYCHDRDLVGPITMLIATGLRRSELLGLRWTDHDAENAMITVTGKVVRVKGQGLMRMDETKTAAGRRTIALPRFAVEMLAQRRLLPFLGQQQVIFPSTAGTLRDPDNFNHVWARVRDELAAILSVRRLRL